MSAGTLALAGERTAAKARGSRLRHAAIGLVVPLAALVAWAASAHYGWLPIQILPEPAIVWDSFVQLWSSGELLDHARVSLLRVLYGFSAGAAVGLALGLAMGLSETVEDYVRPLFTAVAQVPTLAWIPLLMLPLGIDETLKVVIIAKAAFVPMTLNAFAGVRGVPHQFVEVAQAFRFSKAQLLRRVILPGAVAPIFTGVRYGLTKAWTALVAVELLASSEGLGYLLVWGRQMFWLDVVLVAMIAIGVVGFLMDKVLALAETRLQRWRVTAI